MDSSCQSSIGTCQNLEGSAASLRKPPERMNWPCSLPLHALTLTDRIRGLLRSRAKAMNLFCWVLSNSGCPWIMPISKKLLEIVFVAIFPRRQQHDQWYTEHPTFLKFIAQTTMMQLETRKWLRMEFCWSSKELEHENRERATWFLRAEVHLSAWRNFCRCDERPWACQATSLQWCLKSPTLAR